MEKYIQHPIFGIIIAVFIVVLIIAESILKERLLKNRLTLSFVNVSLFVFLFFIYEKYILINEDYILAYLIYSYFIYAIFLISFYQTFKNSFIAGAQYQLLKNGLIKTKWNLYFIVDHKERIKDMSDSLLIELNLDKSEVIGKKLFNIFNKKIRFVKMDDLETNNKDLEKYFINYKKETKPNEYKLTELQFQNYNGELVIINLGLQPIYTFGRYRGRINIGEKKSNEHLMMAEAELQKTNDDLESIRYKFLTTLELTAEGFFSIDLDEQTIWFNENIRRQLKLPTNILNLNEYENLINPDDFKKYQKILSDLTPGKSDYEVSYRLNLNDEIWVSEKGKRLFDDRKHRIIMGTIKPIKTNHFRKTGVDILDEIKDEEYLIPYLNSLIKKERPFQLAIIKLNNIPEINEKFGRQIGNMAIGHYLTRISQTFLTESSDIFRLSGLEFAFTLTDQRKMALIKDGIMSKENYLNILLERGAIKFEVKAYIGIASMYSEAINANDLYQNTKIALNEVLSNKYKSQGLYFSDIK
ncbi:MAG: diguanylate cyclase [Acholeplasmataceae bacterium]